MKHSPLLPLVLATLASTATAQSVETRSTLSDQREVAVTIYNENLALIKDLRQVQLAGGPKALEFGMSAPVCEPRQHSFAA
jgi:hypothetical protein